MKQMILTLGLALAGAFFAHGGVAATCTSAEFDAVQLDSGSVQGCYKDSGNDSASAFNALSLFGYSTWSLLAKDETDNGIGIDEGSGSFTVSGPDFKSSGDFAISDSGSPLYIFVLKGGPNFIAYLLDGLTGSYTMTLLNGGMQVADISHFTVYELPHMPTVPLPASMGMVLGGLTALGALGLRRRG